MTARLRVLDTGLRGGRQNVALDFAQRAAEHPQLRFHRYTPTASLGTFERADDALRREYCDERGIELVRRPSGGGALYHDAGQLAWTLTLPRSAAFAGVPLAAWLPRLNAAAVAGLRSFGVDAQVRTPNDVEIGGRKLASGFLGASTDTLLYQGWLFLDDVDVDCMLRVLRLPKEKLNPDGLLSARGRFVTLREAGVDAGLNAIADALVRAWAAAVDLAPVRATSPRAIAASSARAADDAAAEAADDAGALKAFLRTPGGVLYARARLRADGDAIDELVVSGAVQVFPEDFFAALRAQLRGARVADMDARLNEFFGTHPHEMIGLGAQDVARVIKLALDRRREQSEFDLTLGQANTLMVHARDGDTAAADIAARATVMLVPYCAKPSWCKWRTKEDCVECGLCEVGDAYRLARERAMRAITITNYEHLVTTLEELKRDAVPAYVGMCCGNFFVKRHHAFERAGIPAVLMDISGANCYELQEEDLAYQGKFVAQAHIDLDVLTRVLRRKSGTGA
jgi:lipoate-protein ligase A